MSRRRRIGLVAGVLLVLASRASADPTNLHIHSASHLVTDGGTDLRLPPGYFLDEPSHDKLDTETKRLQDAETRLGAENKSLRASAAGWQPGWYTLIVAIGSGIALGAYLDHKL